jgi:hypothetical protein
MQMHGGDCHRWRETPTRSPWTTKSIDGHNEIGRHAARRRRPVGLLTLFHAPIVKALSGSDCFSMCLLAAAL